MVNSTARQYFFRVVALSSTATASSPSLCINGKDAAVKMHNPIISDLRPVKDKPGCLELVWHKPQDFTLTRKSICSGAVTYELRYGADDQPGTRTKQSYLGMALNNQECLDSLKINKTIRLVDLCSLNPFTRYTVSLRQRYKTNFSDWSDWSNRLQNCTGTAAPTTVPQLWRTIEPAEASNQRHVTLLWKSPSKSQTACTSLWFNASCRSERSHNAPQAWSCLNLTDNRCWLALPTERVACSLTMANSAGSSPPGWLSVPAPTDAVLGAVEKITVRALDDSSLEVRWSAVTRRSLTGFLVEWTPASERAIERPQWERASHEASHVTITDLLPNVRYIVSVWPEFGNESGGVISTQTYTREGVPSIGPRLEVQEQDSSTVLLIWKPPPVEQRHGFITQYSVYCERESITREVYRVAGNKQRHRLTGLSGLYRIYMTAHTVAGEGAAGPALLVTVAEAYSLRTILFRIIPLVFIAVMLLILVAFGLRIKKSVWPWVPDPALSSLSAWFPTAMKPISEKINSGGAEHTSTCTLTQPLHNYTDYQNYVYCPI
ncbi:interleukin-31 receptor subunit alpha isoform X2 [Lampris incognitus]|nr:interleukin-31 receptor subunit alpha isoform X2 [Lampris incognitus]XP_056132510.1 interleukin-31 receptor subunit alpha isoform X2 [Lampris incognitus]